MLAPFIIYYMTELFLTENCGLYEKTENLLRERLAEPFEIRRNENGKPYIAGNPLYFSISHSGGFAMIAICDFPCGVDMELVCGKSRKVVLNSFSDEERAEIDSERDFLKHWVVRESYIKMLGLTLAAKLKSLKYVGGVLYDGGEKADCCNFPADGENFVYSLCVQAQEDNLPEIKKI